ncbi:MAG: hypothetical protein IJ561_04040 [Ruminococcus sp.]|nr:hypothetical protein [Ruminococcus sp.]
MAILPVSYEYRTTLSPKQLARRLDKELIEHRPSLNIMAQGRFMRAHKFESCYYGCRTSSEDFRVFHHTAKKRDGGSTGFYGKMIPEGSGTLIRGSFRKPVYTYVFAAVWTVVILLLALMSAGLKEWAAAGAFAVLWAAGAFLMLKDNKKSAVRAYIESLPGAETGDTGEGTE